MMDARAIARVLGGRVVGRNRVACPGPGHSRHDRSLCLLITSDDIVVHSHAGDDWQTCKEYVARTLGLPQWKPNGSPEARRREKRQDIRADQQRADDLARTKLARALWDQGVDPRGTPADAYLRARKLVLTDELAGSVLRFHPSAVWNKDHPDYPPGCCPILLAAFRSLETDEIVAVHRIRVDVPRLWPKTLRMMLGPVKGAAVKLAPVTDTLAVAEGIETAMAANIMGHGPAWALGSVGAIERLPVLPGISRLILLQENNEASRLAVQHCGQRWLRAGRKVTRIWPSEGCDDLNDELMGTLK
jgi:putative DNA primase/helicase